MRLADKPLLTIGELKKTIQDIPDNVKIRYQTTKNNEFWQGSPVHSFIHGKNTPIFFIVTEYVDNQTTLKEYK